MINYLISGKSGRIFSKLSIEDGESDGTYELIYLGTDWSNQAVITILLPSERFTYKLNQ